jgi:hypothetical protein
VSKKLAEDAVREVDSQQEIKVRHKMCVFFLYVDKALITQLHKLKYLDQSRDDKNMIMMTTMKVVVT